MIGTGLSSHCSPLCSWQASSSGFMPVIRKPPLYSTTLQQDRAPDQVSRFSQIDLLLQAGLILNRISKCSCETYGKRARIGSELVLGFRASLRVFDGDLYNEFSTTNILLGPRNLCSHVILVERRNFDVHAFCHSRSPLMYIRSNTTHLKPGVVRCVEYISDAI